MNTERIQYHGSDNLHPSQNGCCRHRPRRLPKRRSLRCQSLGRWEPHWLLHRWLQTAANECQQNHGSPTIEICKYAAKMQKVLGCHNLMGYLTITTLTSMSLGILLPPPGLNAGEKPYSLVTFNGILYTWYCS